MLSSFPRGSLWCVAGLVGMVVAGIQAGAAGLTVAAGVFGIATALHRGLQALILVPFFHDRPSLALVTGFAVVIFAGTLTLALAPRCLAEGQQIGLVDALFTATSGTCVIGLETRATGGTFSRFGQGVVLALIQVGGLGIMTLGTFLLLHGGARLGVGSHSVMGEALNLEDLGRLRRLTLVILVTTVVFECLGALAFLPWFPEEEGGVFAAVFHSVSAFCNAGIALRGDSFQGFAGSVWFNVVAMTLIILGGLGFIVLGDTGRWLTGFFRRHRRARNFSLHSRIVLIASAVLIVVCALSFWALESDGSLKDAEVGEAALVSTFQSVSSRTAGFSTVDFGSTEGEGLKPSTRFFLLLPMFIGASPGSTGGGLKTVTLVVLLLAVLALFRDREEVELFGRSIPDSIVKRAAAIVLCYLLTLFLAVLAMTVTDGGHLSTADITFECTSAIATVGYSVGVSGAEELSDAGKLILIVLMFAGRLGPLTLVLFTAPGGEPPPAVEYPPERVMIG